VSVAAEATAARGRHARGTTEEAPAGDAHSSSAEPAATAEAATTGEAAGPAEDRLAAAGIDIDLMLQQLAASHAAQPLGGLSSRLADKSSRTFLIVGGVVGLTLVSFLAMFLLGSVFG
jgi:hypothetical protein